MEVEYKKDLKHNYMVLTQEEHRKVEPYSLRVMEYHSLAGALPVTLRRMDNKLLFYYDITAKQSLLTILDRAVLTLDQLKKLCIGILHILEASYEYLLMEEGFILSPEYIFIDIANYTPFFCYLPGYGLNIDDQMNSLMEYLMNKIDYNDKEAVLLVYQLYAVCRESGFAYDQFIELLKLKPKDNNILSQKEAQKLAENVGSQKEILSSDEGNQYKSISIRKELLAEGQINDMKIPVVMEKVEGEAEIYCYSFKTYLYCIGCISVGIIVIIASLVTKLLFNSFRNNIDFSKLFALILIIMCVEGYLLNRILHKKNKITKIIKTCDYIDPRLVKSPLINQAATENLNKILNPKREVQEDALLQRECNPVDKDTEEKDINPTCLLDAVSDQKHLILKAQDDINYKNIRIVSFPFFIGKFKKNVDYCLEKDVISRFHAKITQEGDHYYLTDLNSTNGTFINDEALQTYERKEIKIGDIITFADIKFQLNQE